MAIENNQEGAQASSVGNFGQMAMGTPGIKILAANGTYSGDISAIWAREESTVTVTASNDGDDLAAEPFFAGESIPFFGKNVTCNTGRIWVFIR